MGDVCLHEFFDAEVEIDRITDGPGGAVVGFYANVKVRCATCRTRFKFVGLPVGLDPARPMCDPSRMELRAPISPDAHTTSLMASLPGFQVRRAAPPASEGEEG